MDIKKYVIDDFNPTKISEKIARRMQARRILLNITQKELANQSGVSLGSVKRFESKHLIALQSLIRIAVVLDATIEFQQLFPMNQFNRIPVVLRAAEKQPRQRALDA